MSIKKFSRRNFVTRILWRRTDNSKLVTLEKKIEEFELFKHEMLSFRWITTPTVHALTSFDVVHGLTSKILKPYVKIKTELVNSCSNPRKPKNLEFFVTVFDIEWKTHLVEVSIENGWLNISKQTIWSPAMRSRYCCFVWDLLLKEKIIERLHLLFCQVLKVFGKWTEFERGFN